MRRREFITLLGGAAAWPLAARAQQPDRMRRIGVLMASAENNSQYQTYMVVFRDAFQNLGWAESNPLLLHRLTNRTAR
jgi:putative tryptophan/tyrosine transport system substrate-binding protein